MFMLVLHRDALFHWPADLFLTLLGKCFSGKWFSIKRRGIWRRHDTQRIDIQHKILLVTFSITTLCHYAECQYTECRSRFIYCYADCHDAEWRYAECCYAECRGANLNRPRLRWNLLVITRMDLQTFLFLSWKLLFLDHFKKGTWEPLL
jgi:hypothetical protein